MSGFGTRFARFENCYEKKGITMNTIQSQRLLLRPVEPGDLADVYEYSKHPEVGSNAGWKPHESIEETRQIMNEVFVNRENVWGIIWKENQKLVGTVGLINDEKRSCDAVLMLGYAIGKPYWGNGIMTEVAKAVIAYGFEVLKLKLITANCYPTNLRSRRVLEKCGMTYEGCLRMVETLYDGRTMDHLCFSISEEEYRSQNYQKR